MTEQDILDDYKYLPFQASDVIELFSNIKQIKRTNPDVKANLAQAHQFFRENQLNKAFELFSYCINVYLQVSGPVNEEVASCIANIAQIQFKLGDFLQAIELLSKAIILQEKLLGLDHPHVGFNYSTLSMYYLNSGYFAKGFDYMHKALAIL